MSLLTDPRAPAERRRLIALLGAIATGGVLSACATPPAPQPAVPASSPQVEPVQPAPPPAPPPVQRVPLPPRIGLALGGGAARGFAHIGVIEVLEDNGLRPSLVVGTSAGSLVAALYASGRNAHSLEKVAANLDESAFADWSFPGRGLIRGEALARYVREFTGGRLIEQMAMPLGIVATDLDSGQPVLFQRGDPGSAVRASSAVPALFQPVRISGREYVDGGLVSPVPVRFARQMGADMVVAVDISAATQGAATGDALRMLMQTFAIMGRSISQHELRDADVVVRPLLAGVAGTDFAGRQKAIAAGRTAAVAALPELKLQVAKLAR